MSCAEGNIVAGSFCLIRRLSEGGMGTVWVAHHTRLDVPCAVKFLHPELAERPDLVARFEREAKAAAQLKGPHVVEILDYGIFEGAPYIAMELLEGEDLGRRVSTRGRLSPAATLTIVEQVGRALEKAHARGIVHRDLKPENVFLVSDGDREIAKVLDFGIAKDTGSQLKLTSKGMVLGTPVYMSPEQIMGKVDVDHRADLWSLAIVTFECLTGKLPVAEGAFADIAANIALRDLPMPSSMASDLPPAIDVWWAKATMKEREARYQSARELTEALARALTPRASQPDLVVEAPPPAQIWAPLPRPRGHARHVSSPTRLAVPASSESVTMAAPLGRGSSPEAVWSNTPPPHKHRSFLVVGAVMACACVLLAGAALRAWVLPQGSSAAASSAVAMAPSAPPSATAVVPAVMSAEPAAPARGSASAAVPKVVPPRHAVPRVGVARTRSGS